MLSVLLSLLIVLIVIGLCYWVITQIPLPAPIRSIAIVVLVVVAAIYLIYVLIGLGAAIPLGRWR